MTPARRVVAAAVVLLACQAALLVSTALDTSDTYDEPIYVGAGVLQVAHGDVRTNCEAPVLPKWGFGLAVTAVDPDVTRVADDVVAARERALYELPYAAMRRNLLAARAATIAVVLAGGVFLWLAVRRFGERAALLALALWCTSPTLLAAGSLATLDAWTAAVGAAALWAALRAVERPNLARTALLGAVTGLGAACKVTVLGALPFTAGATLAALARGTPPGARPGRLCAAVVVLLGSVAAVLCAVYGVAFGTVALGHPCGLPWRFAADGALGPVPLAPWIEGALAQLAHARAGHPNYLRGVVSRDGWWWFFLACLAFKLTLGVQGRVVLRLAAMVRARPGRRDLVADALLLGFPVLLFALMSASRLQNGIKYLLPTLPFALVWLSRVADEAPRAFGRAGTALVVALLVWSAGSMLAVHPHHLMFFNAWAGGPEGGPRWLVHGDDWGQDQRRLARWQREQAIDTLFYAAYSGRPERWGVHFVPPPCEPTPGVYALQAVEVHRPRTLAPGCLDWLTVEPPDERLGWSIYVYRVDAARIARLDGARAAGRSWVHTGDQPRAQRPAAASIAASRW